ncbi:hypothetical protein [Aquibium oceanicum]|uniref:Uncharacterized protein n=1 Tax=Aquibium oceanicum TaxID=1670800 RepID=A0A1L3SP15_9HYPH|nr:hypothetical protein [Aquibium oceanicum]APH71120.1 hypothetical protein BSQ44_06855 [Aquibium oceanicum]
MSETEQELEERAVAIATAQASTWHNREIDRFKFIGRLANLYPFRGRADGIKAVRAAVLRCCAEGVLKTWPGEGPQVILTLQPPYDTPTREEHLAAKRREELEQFKKGGKR